MSFLTVPVIKNSYILTGTYFIPLTICPGPNLRVFQFRIWTCENCENQILTCEKS